ncbi:hypothetical protein [Pseudactinotalea sp.]|uniref:hypothetical protein n=1 Tax=Pseudactinotalea sp. TaxID=1926260 RepID=UPI003B3B4E96
MLNGIFGRQKSEPVAEVPPELAEALVRADESVRRGTDELGYATAEFGEVAVRELADALRQAQTHLQEAFRLNALLLDDQPETPAQRQQLEAGALAAAREAEQVVRGPASALAAQRAALRDAPATIARLRAEADDVAGRVEDARAAIAALAARYSDEAVLPVADNAEQAQALLTFADRSLHLAERRHESGRGDEATKALQVASDSVRRAEALLDAVTDHEVESVHAESTLAAVLADSRTDVAEARQLLAAADDPDVAAAAAALEQALAAAGQPEAAGDPFTSLSRVRAANTALEQLVQDRRRRPEREREREHLLAALADADRQVALARTLIADHPGQIGSQARTRLAQAERLLDGVTDLDDPAAALAQVRQAADLAAGAADRARADLTAGVSHRQDAPPWAPDPGRGGAGSVLGGVLGGMVLGGILDGLDDIDLDFD